MSKQFLTRIVAASASASLVIFAAAIPAKASSNIQLAGEIPATCSFNSASITAGNVNGTAQDGDVVLTVTQTSPLVATATVGGIFQLTGGLTDFDIGTNQISGSTQGIDYSDFKYSLSGGDTVSARVLSAPWDVNTVLNSTGTTLLAGGSTDITLSGTINIDASAKDFFGGSAQTITSGKIPVGITFAVTCAPRANPN